MCVYYLVVGSVCDGEHMRLEAIPRHEALQIGTLLLVLSHSSLLVEQSTVKILGSGEVSEAASVGRFSMLKYCAGAGTAATKN
jgi:hypothetical protein